MKLIHLVIFISCCLAGCTSQLNQNSVKPYTNHTLNHFIRDRFTINNSLNNTLQHGLDVFESNKEKNLYNFYSASKPLPDGSYVFYAPFNQNNLLETPKKELALFCNTKGGTLKTISIYNKNILLQHEPNPIQAYISSVHNLARARIASDFGTRSLTADEIRAIALETAMRVENSNHYSDLSYAKEDYLSAINSNSFGVFNCAEQESNRSLWLVSIIPIAYEPSNKEHFILDALYLGIKEIN